MKVFTLLFIIILLTNFICFGQIEDEKYPQLKDYYPYHIGDVWQYYSYSNNDFLTNKITRIDTSENGRFHFIYYNNEILCRWIVDLDSNFVYSNGHNYPIYKFNVPSCTRWLLYDDDTWRMNHNYYSVMIDYEIVDAINFANYSSYPADTLTLTNSGDVVVKGIGFYSHWWEIGEEKLNGWIINGRQYGILVGIDEETLPIDYKLKISNYPNPFNNQTIINYSIPDDSYINLTIYNILGEKIETLVDVVQVKGNHAIPWQAKGVSSGIYFAVLKFKNKIVTQKIIFQK